MVDALTTYGLVMAISEDEENFFAVTPRGMEFVDTYWKMKGF